MKQITIATYNIRHGHDVKFDWSKIAELIDRSGADIVGLQEIDMHTARVGGRDTVSGLVQTTGLPHALFVPAMDFDGGQYGTAILSRFPITAHEIHPLQAGKYEPRSFGCITVSPRDGVPVCFLNTHLSYESRKQQDLQFNQLAVWMDAYIPKDVPTVLTGDFNTEDFTAFMPLQAIGFGLANHEENEYKTFRTTRTAIDNIVYRESKMKPVDMGMIDSNRSDHNLLWCRFEFL